MNIITDKVSKTIAAIAPSIYPAQPGDSEVAHLIKAILRIKGINATVFERGRTIDKDGAFILLVNVDQGGQPAALNSEPYIGHYNGAAITLYKVESFWDKKGSAFLSPEVDGNNVMEIVL